MMPPATAGVVTPFPGLRSYRITEADWFFGREGKSDAMAKKLARGRFLAVVGESGCGKSSLVRAGLLSTLEAGLLPDAGSSWKIVDMHPGGDPIGRLSAALAESGYTEGSGREVLERDPGALAKVYAAHPSFRGSLLLLVDQFEELFRYSAHRDEKAGFVQLILEAARQPHHPIYVVITMRSDFLGECAQFRGLPEEINEGQYLVPRMTRENLREAIEGPIRLAGAEIEPRLTQVLLDEVGSEPDQLPVLQHALMRTWNNWVARGNADDPVREDPDYIKTGRLQNALSDHADEALRDAATALGSREKAETLAAVVFPLLWDRDANGRDVRRPSTLGEMTAVSGAASSDIRLLLDEFRKPGRTFISASREEKPDANSDDIEFDVTHESFLRKWKILRDTWIPAEITSRRIYLRLVQQALDCDPKDPSYMDGRVLDETVEWAVPSPGIGRRKPTPVWAMRYSSAFPNEAAGALFPRAMEFLEDSRRAREDRRADERKAELTAKRKRWAYFIIAVSVLGLVVVGLLALGLRYQKRHATVLAMASRAILASQNPEQLERSLLLAAESERIEPTIEAQALLSRSLELLPKPQPDLSQTGARYISYNADSTRLAAADRDGHITIWDTSGKEPPKSLQGPAKIRGLWWLKDRLLLLSKNAPAQILSLDGSSIDLKGCNADTLAVSPDATQVVEHCPGPADAEFDAVVLWSLDSPNPKLKSQLKVKSIDPDYTQLDLGVSNPSLPFSKAAPWIAIVVQDKIGVSSTVSLYSVKLRKYADPAKPEAHLLAFEFDGDYLNAAGADGRIYTWAPSHDASSQQLDGFSTPLDSKAFDFAKTKMKLSRDYVIAGAASKAVAVWDAEGRQLAMASASAPVTAIAVGKDEFCALGRDGNLRRWQIPQKKTLARSSSGIFSPDGKWLIARYANRWSVLDAQTGQQHSAQTVRDFSPRAFDSTGNFVSGLMTRSNSETGYKYEVRRFSSGDVLQVALGGLQLPPKATLVTQRFSPDGKALLTSALLSDSVSKETEKSVDKYVVEVWDWESGKTLASQYPAAFFLAFYAPDSGTVFLDDREVLSAWHIKENKVEPVPFKTDGVRTLWATLPNKGLAACAVTAREPANSNADAERDEDLEVASTEATSGNQVIVWQYPNWQEQARLDHPNRVRLVSFSQDGSQILTVTTDGTVRLWDWKQQKQLALIPVGASVTAASITPDGQIAVLGRSKFTVYGWQPEKLREQVCERVRENLSVDEWTKGFLLEEADYPVSKLCTKLPNAGAAK